MQAKLLLENVNVYNSYIKKFINADVYIKNGKFYFIDENKTEKLEVEQTLNLGGKYIVPGLIDIHMHIESSMLTPKAFSDRLANIGVTTIVSEPHEIANVKGIDGVQAMIKAGENNLIDIFYGVPSSVPASSEDLETTGGRIDFEDMLKLKENPAVICVGEVMNYRQIIKENDLEVTKFIENIRKDDQVFPIEGHCPALIGLDLAKFLYLGINADHTEHTIEEFRQRFLNGMFVEIQEKTLTRELLDLIEEHNLWEHFCFVTDDVMADTFLKDGQLDRIVKKAMTLGMCVEDAIYATTYTPSRRMNLLDRGIIAPGKLADFVILENLDEFKASDVYKNGEKISGRPQSDGQEFPRDFYDSVKVDKVSEDVFKALAPIENGTVTIRVAKMSEGSTRTEEIHVDLPVINYEIQWEHTPYMLCAVFERYGKNGNIGFGFITGDCHKSGAVATTYAHDNHNLLVAGSTKKDMVRAVNEIIDLKGGFVVCKDEQILSGLQLSVGGILSDKSLQEVGTKIGEIRASMTNLGYNHKNPIMSFSVLALTVSPKLKITDKGLIDVTEGKVVSYIV